MCVRLRELPAPARRREPVPALRQEPSPVLRKNLLAQARVFAHQR